MATEAEKSDIIVVLDESVGDLDHLTTLLKQSGMEVDSVDADNGVVEGTIQTVKLKSLEKIPGVKFVRDVFNYVDDEDGVDDDTIPG